MRAQCDLLILIKHQRLQKTDVQSLYIIFSLCSLGIAVVVGIGAAGVVNLPLLVMLLLVLLLQ